MFNLNATAYIVWSERHCFFKGEFTGWTARTPTSAFLFQPGGNIHCLQITLEGRLGKEAQKFTGLGSLTPSWALLYCPLLREAFSNPLNPKYHPSLLSLFIFIEFSFACCLSPLLEGGDFEDSLLYSQHLKSCRARSRQVQLT